MSFLTSVSFGPRSLVIDHYKNDIQSVSSLSHSIKKIGKVFKKTNFIVCSNQWTKYNENHSKSLLSSQFACFQCFLLLENMKQTTEINVKDSIEAALKAAFKT